MLSDEGNLRIASEASKSDLFDLGENGNADSDARETTLHGAAKPGGAGGASGTPEGERASKEEARAARAGFEALGLRLVRGIRDPEAKGVPARIVEDEFGNIVLEYNTDILIEDESDGINRGLIPGQFTRLTLGEELVHGAYARSNHNDWVKAGRPGSFSKFSAETSRGVFDDIRQTMEGLPVYQTAKPLYRVVKFWNAADRDRFVLSFRGDVWRNCRAFMSSTKQVNVVARLAGKSNYQVYIEIQDPRSARDVEPFSFREPQYAWQKEAIFMRDSEFDVIGNESIDLPGKLVYKITLKEKP